MSLDLLVTLKVLCMFPFFYLILTKKEVLNCNPAIVICNMQTYSSFINVMKIVSVSLRCCYISAVGDHMRKKGVMIW